MKKKGFTLTELLKLLIFLIIMGLLIFMFISLIRKAMIAAIALDKAIDKSSKNGEVKSSKNGEVKPVYFAIIANEDPNQVNVYENVIYHFERYLSALSSPVPLRAATAEDVEGFLKEREKILQQEIVGETADRAIKETMEFNRKVLMKWLETVTKLKKQKVW